MPCIEDHDHASWPMQGEHELVIEACETICGWCDYKTKHANNLRVHARRHIANPKDESLSGISIGKGKAGRKRVQMRKLSTQSKREGRVTVEPSSPRSDVAVEPSSPRSDIAEIEPQSFRGEPSRMIETTTSQAPWKADWPTPNKPIRRESSFFYYYNPTPTTSPSKSGSDFDKFKHSGSSSVPPSASIDPSRTAIVEQGRNLPPISSNVLFDPSTPQNRGQVASEDPGYAGQQRTKHTLEPYPLWDQLRPHDTPNRIVVHEGATPRDIFEGDSQKAVEEEVWVSFVSG